MWLSLSQNPLVCNERMKWIQIGEQEGWIYWPEPRSFLQKPKCTNNNEVWDNITLPGETACKISNEDNLAHKVSNLLCWGNKLFLPTILFLQMVLVQLVSLTTLVPCSVRTVDMDSTRMKQINASAILALMNRQQMVKPQLRMTDNVVQVYFLTNEKPT